MSRTRVLISSVESDKSWREHLLVHLNVLAFQGLIDVWDDSQTFPGTPWKAAINERLDHARIVVLLISANFLTSNFMTDEHIPEVLRRHQGDGLLLYPILIRHCAWQQVEWLKPLSIRPLGDKPLSASRSKLDQQLTSIAVEIAGLVQAHTAALLGRRLDRQEAQLSSITDQLQHYQLRETVARAEASVNLGISVRVLPFETSQAGQSVALETRIRLENNGTDTLTIAAAYVSVRAFNLAGSRANTTNGVGSVRASHQGQLRAATHRITPVDNVSALPQSLRQVSPDEVEELVHWTLIGGDAASDLGLAIVCVNIFTASTDIIGIRYIPSRKEMPLHDAWIKYMNSSSGQYCVFDRIASIDIDTGSPATLRVLRKYNGSGPPPLELETSQLPLDEENTGQFRELLDTIVEWDRHYAVSITGTPSRHPS